jgi:hypothetical protein
MTTLYLCTAEQPSPEFFQVIIDLEKVQVIRWAQNEDPINPFYIRFEYGDNESVMTEFASEKSLRAGLKHIFGLLKQDTAMADTVIIPKIDKAATKKKVEAKIKQAISEAFC